MAYGKFHIYVINSIFLCVYGYKGYAYDTISLTDSVATSREVWLWNLKPMKQKWSYNTATER